MGCLLSCLVCNASSCLCSGACTCFGKVIPMSHFAGRVAYTALFFFFSFIAWIFRFWAKELFKWVPQLKVCEGGACYGVLAVYRISFGLAIFHLLMALLTIGIKKKGDVRTNIQDGFWFIKIAVIVIVCAGAFFLPNEVFEIYGWISVFASGLFILIQLVYLIDFAHSWADNWIGKYEDREDQDSHFWWWMLLLVTLVMFTASLVGSILMYVFFTDCGVNIFFITLNIVFCILISAGSIHPKVQEVNIRSGLLQPALISAYCTYLVFSSIQSETGHCNPLYKEAAANNLSLLIGAIFTICALCYSTVRAASRSDVVVEEKEPLTKEEEGTDESQEQKSINNDPDEPVAYNFSRFHLIFALGAMYLAMLMTDWHTISGADSDPPTVDSGWTSVWVKIVSGWLCSLLYGWTLLGPILLPDREWFPEH